MERDQRYFSKLFIFCLLNLGSLYRYLEQRRLDVIGLYFGDCERMSYPEFFRKEPEESSLRTILIEIEHKHFLEKAVERIKNIQIGKKVIIWTEGEMKLAEKSLSGFFEDEPDIYRIEDLGDRDKVNYFNHIFSINPSFR